MIPSVIVTNSRTGESEIVEWQSGGLDAVGVMAALNVVLGVWPLQDAANAVGVEPERLVFEAQAWAVAAALEMP